jgi:hypothetical protein
MSLRLVPVTFGQAKEFVADWHRHNVPPIGHKFSIGVANADDVLVGVAVVGRPISRHYDDGLTLEINRTATDGTKNANSMLYGAARRAAFALGYRRLITYTNTHESGSSLRAANYKIIATRPPTKGWDTPSRPRDNSRHNPNQQRYLWEVLSDTQ